MSTTTSSVPGLVLPKVQAPLAGNPNNSAIAANNQRTASHAALLNAVKGGSKRGGAITVPQMHGDKSGANSVAAAQAQVSTQNASNSALDDLQAGGRRRTKGKRKRRRTTKRRTTKRRTSKRRSRRAKK